MQLSVCYLVVSSRPSPDMVSIAYILILPPTNSRSLAFVGGGKEKKQWFVRLPRGVDEYTWGEKGEEGEEYGRSVKSLFPCSLFMARYHLS